MDELVRWLGEQLDEDERIARATHPVFLAWEYDHSVREVRDLGNGNELVHGIGPHYGEHIAEHDPARVLREIDAKRRMIEAFERTSYGENTAPHEDMRNVSGAKVDSWRFALRLLALSYIDRPGYREEWRP